MRQIVLLGIVAVLATAACEVREAEEVPGEPETLGVVGSDFYDQLGWGALDEWDLDADTYLDRDEWAVAYERADMYGDWDVDNDAFMYGDEYVTGMFRAWDVDEDAGLDPDEWETGTGLFSPDIEWGDWAAWDLDGDDILGEDEFRATFEKKGLFRLWGADDSGALDREEFEGIMFELWDADGDGRISAAEWAAGVERWPAEPPEDIPGGQG